MEEESKKKKIGGFGKQILIQTLNSLSFNHGAAGRVEEEVRGDPPTSAQAPIAKCRNT